MHVIINMLKHNIIIIISFIIYIVCYSGGCWSGDSHATVVTYVHSIVLFGGEKGGGGGSFEVIIVGTHYIMLQIYY